MLHKWHEANHVRLIDDFVPHGLENKDVKSERPIKWHPHNKQQRTAACQ